MSAKTHTVTLASGRVLEFWDFDYTPEFGGSLLDPPTPADCSIAVARWADTGEALTEAELERLHDDDADYGFLLDAVTELKDAERAADIANGCDEVEP